MGGVYLHIYYESPRWLRECWAESLIQLGFTLDYVTSPIDERSSISCPICFQKEPTPFGAKLHCLGRLEAGLFWISRLEAGLGLNRQNPEKLHCFIHPAELSGYAIHYLRWPADYGVGTFLGGARTRDSFRMVSSIWLMINFGPDGMR